MGLIYVGIGLLPSILRSLIPSGRAGKPPKILSRRMTWLGVYFTKITFAIYLKDKFTGRETRDTEKLGEPSDRCWRTINQSSVKRLTRQEQLRGPVVLQGDTAPSGHFGYLLEAFSGCYSQWEELLAFSLQRPGMLDILQLKGQYHAMKNYPTSHMTFKYPSRHSCRWKPQTTILHLNYKFL